MEQLEDFVGNVEGRDIFPCKADVYVTDGVVGNILLKFGESIPKALKQMVTDASKGGLDGKARTLGSKKCIKEITYSI